MKQGDVVIVAMPQFIKVRKTLSLKQLRVVHVFLDYLKIVSINRYDKVFAFDG